MLYNKYIFRKYANYDFMRKSRSATAFKNTGLAQKRYYAKNYKRYKPISCGIVPLLEYTKQKIKKSFKTITSVINSVGPISPPPIWGLV